MEPSVQPPPFSPTFQFDQGKVEMAAGAPDESSGGKYWHEEST